MKIHFRFIALLCLLLASTLSQAGPILWIDDSIGRIGKVDVATGTSTLVGSAGVVLTDIAFNPSGNLFGISFNNLYGINTTTGAATLIGGAFPSINALTFSSTGTLYGAGGSNFYTLNPTTGAATLVGNMGSGSAGDLAFHNGDLYLSSSSGNLVRINLGTGAGTIIGSLGAAAGAFGLANGDDNVLYAVNGTNVYSVNTTTGAGTLAVGYGGGAIGPANGTAFFQEASAPPPPPSGVPEPASVALLALGLAGIGFSRRKHA